MLRTTNTHPNKIFRGISRQFILRIFIFSVAITIAYAIFHLYFEYSKVISQIDRAFERIQSTHIQTITQSVWSADTKLLELQLNSIAGYPHIHHLELKAKDLAPITIGIKKENYVRRHEYPIIYTYRNQRIDLGTLLVCMDLEYLFRELATDAILIVISEAVKIFFFSAFIFYFFHSLVGRHLGEMARYTEDFDLNNPGDPLTLNRAINDDDEAEDELEQLVKSINRMQRNIIDDFEARAQIEAKLRASEHLYRELVESTEDLITLVDGQGNFVFANHNAEKIFGYSADQLKGKNAFEFLHPEDYEKTTKWLEACIAQHKAQDSIENRQVNLVTNEVHYMLWTSNFHYEEDGQLSSVGGIAHDITARRKNAERELRIKKLEATGVLAGGIAHDFNNLLAVIKGYAELAKEETATSNTGLCKMINQIDAATDRATDLTKKFLTFSTGGAPVKDICSIGKLLEQTTSSVLTETDIRFEHIFPSNLWMVNCDQKQIVQAFANIIINAKESMPEGGVVQIKADNISSEEVSRRTGQECKDDRYVVLSISDQGCGIPESDLPQIFDPYFSTKDRGARKGMGLGLSIASSIIHKHNGYILVQSKPNSGTTFTLFLPAVDLPLVDRAASGKPTNQKEARDLAVTPYKIMIMDDEEMLLEMTKSQIDSLGQGYLVVTVGHGEEAIAAFSAAVAEGSPFDLLILDLTIKGGVGGKDTLAKIQETFPQVKAIACSGYSEDPVIANCEKYGFVGAMAKPFSRTALASLIERVLAS